MATKLKLNPVTNYLKNVTKSMTYAAADIGKDLMPNIGEFTNSNKEFLKTTYSVLRNPKNTLKKSVGAIQESKIYQALDYGIKNTFEDLRTGNFYNMERINRDEMKLAGFDLDDMNNLSEFDIDDNWESKLNEKPVKKNEITDGDIKIINAIEGSNAANASATVNAVIKSSDYQVKSSRANFGQLYMQNERLFGGLHQDISIVGATVESIQKITSAALQNIDKNMSDFFTSEIKLSQERNAILKEMLELQRNMYTSAANKEKAENDKNLSKAKKNRWSDIQSNGIADFESYFEVIKKNVGNTIAGLGIPAFNENSNMLATMMTSPLKGITHAMLNAVIPATVKAATKEFDNMLSGIFGHGIARLSNAKSSGSGGIFGFLAKIFGINTSVNFGIDTGKYEKGPVPFDGITRKAIIDIIPTYLRRIEAHLSGKPEQTFNYSTGKWVILQSVKKDIDAIKNNMVSRGTNNIKELMASGIKATKQSDKHDRESFNNALEEFWKYLTDRNGIFNPNVSAEKNNISAAKYPALYKNYELICTLFANAGYTEVMDKKGNIKKFNRGYDTKVKLSSDILEAKDSAEKAIRALEETSTSVQQYYSALGIDTHGKWNKENKFNATNNVLMIKDKLGNTIFDYLKNINTELVWWRTSAYEEIYSNLASINFGSVSSLGKSSKSKRKRNSISHSQFISQARISNRSNKSYESIFNSNILENNDQKKERESRQKRINDTDEQTKRKVLDAINKGEAIDTSVLNNEQIKEYLVALITEANSESYKRELEGYDTAILKGLRSKNITSYKEFRELKKKQEKEEEKDNEKEVEEKKETFIQKALGKIKQGASIGESIIGATGEVISNLIMTANKSIYEMMYKAEIEDDDNEEGKKKYDGFMDMIQKKITNTFDIVKSYFKDKILDPIKEWLGIDKNNLKTRFTDELKTVGKDLWKNFADANKDLWGPLLNQVAVNTGLKKGKTTAQKNRASERENILGDMDIASKMANMYDPNFISLLNKYGLNALDYGTNFDAAIVDVQKEIKKRYINSTNNLSEFSNKNEYDTAFEYLNQNPSMIKQINPLQDSYINWHSNFSLGAKRAIISNAASKSITGYKKGNKDQLLQQAEDFGLIGSTENKIKIIKELDPNADVSKLNTDEKLALKFLRLVNKRGTYATGSNGTFVTGPALLSKGEYIIDKSTGKTGMIKKTDLYDLGNNGTAVIRNPNSGTTVRGDTDKERLIAKKYKIKGYADGTINPKVDEVIINNNKISSETILSEAKKNLPEGLAGGAIGGLLLSLVGLPLSGMVIGAGSSIIKNSSTLSEQLFGKKDDKTGERDNSGFISKKIIDTVKKYSPDMIKYGLAGILPGLITPLGPIGGLLVGSTIGFLKNNEKFTNKYFGEQGKLSIKSKEKQILQDLLPGAAKGALAGIASHIFLIPKLLPGLSLGGIGLVGALLIGSGLGMAASTEEFKNAVLGEPDKDGNREGGLLGAIKDSFAPIVDAGVEFKDKLLSTLENNIMEPLSQFAQPFIHELPRIATWLPNKINDILENHFGRSLSGLFKDFIGKPIGGLISKVALPVVNTAANIITSPVKLLGAAGKKIRKDQIKDKRADYMTAKERIEWSIENKGTVSDFDRAMAGIGSGVEGTFSVDQAKNLRDSLNMINDSRASLASSQKKAEKDMSRIIDSIKGKDGKDLSAKDREKIRNAIKAGKSKEAKRILMQNGLSESEMNNIFSDNGFGLDSKMKKYSDILNRKKTFSKLTKADKAKAQSDIAKLLDDMGIKGIDLNDDKSRRKLLANLNTEIEDREANGTENVIEPIEKVGLTAEKINLTLESIQKTIIDIYTGNTDDLKKTSDKVQADIDEANKKNNETFNKRKSDYAELIGKAKYEEWAKQNPNNLPKTAEEREKMIKEFGMQHVYQAKTDENGNVLRDKNGDIIYENDAEGNPVINKNNSLAIDYATKSNGKSGFEKFSEGVLNTVGAPVGTAIKAGAGLAGVGIDTVAGTMKLGSGVVKLGTDIVGGAIHLIPTKGTRSLGRNIQNLGNKLYNGADNITATSHKLTNALNDTANSGVKNIGDSIFSLMTRDFSKGKNSINKYISKYGIIVNDLLQSGVPFENITRYDDISKWYIIDKDAGVILFNLSKANWKEISRFLNNTDIHDFINEKVFKIDKNMAEYLASLTSNDFKKLKNACIYYLNGGDSVFGGNKKHLKDFGSFADVLDRFKTSKSIKSEDEPQQIPAYSAASAVLEGTSLVGQGLWDGIKTVGKAAWSGAKVLGKAAWSGAKVLGKTAWSGIKSVGKSIGNGAKAVGRKAYNSVNNLTNGILDKVINGISSVGSNIFNGIKTVTGKFKKVDKLGPGPNDYGIIIEKSDGSFEPDTSDSKTKQIIDKLTKSEKEQQEANKAQIKMEEQMGEITAKPTAKEPGFLAKLLGFGLKATVLASTLKPLFENILKPLWDVISPALSSIWQTTIKPAILYTWEEMLIPAGSWLLNVGFPFLVKEIPKGFSRLIAETLGIVTKDPESKANYDEYAGFTDKEKELANKGIYTENSTKLLYLNKITLAMTSVYTAGNQNEKQIRNLMNNCIDKIREAYQNGATCDEIVDHIIKYQGSDYKGDYEELPEIIEGIVRGSQSASIKFAKAMEKSITNRGLGFWLTAGSLGSVAAESIIAGPIGGILSNKLIDDRYINQYLSDNGVENINADRSDLTRDNEINNGEGGNYNKPLSKYGTGGLFDNISNAASLIFNGDFTNNNIESTLSIIEKAKQGEISIFSNTYWNNLDGDNIIASGYNTAMKVMAIPSIIVRDTMRQFLADTQYLSNEFRNSKYSSSSKTNSNIDNLRDPSAGLQFQWSINNNALDKRLNREDIENMTDEEKKELADNEVKNIKKAMITFGSSKYGKGKYNKEVWWYLRNKMGLSEAGAAGIIANMEDESGVDPGVVSDYVKQAQGYTNESFTKGVNDGSISKDTFVNARLDPDRDSYGYGLVQWYANDRKRALYERTVEKKIPIDDLVGQLDFLNYETTQERTSRYANMINTLKTTDDPAVAANIFNEVFEVSGVAPTSRQNKAKNIYNELKGTSGTAISGSTYKGVSASSSNSSSSSSSNGNNNKSYPGIFNMLRGYLNNSRAGRVFNSILGNNSSSSSDENTSSNINNTSSGLQVNWSINNNALNKRLNKEDTENVTDEQKVMNTFGSGKYSKQIDPNISNIRFNASGDSEYQTIGDSGCGPAAAVNAIESMYGRSKRLINAARFAIKGGYKERNGGTRPEFFKNYFASRGYDSQTTSNRNTLINNIRAGAPTVLMGQDNHGVSDSTPYGRNPHYVTATGIDNKGRVIIQDPESRYDNQLYSINDVMRKTSFGVSAFGRGSINSIRHSREQIRGISSPTKFKYRFGTGLTYEKIAKQDLGKFSKLTAADMNKAIKEINSSSPFNGHGDIFIEASNKTGLDPRYILAHAAWESAWGTSAICQDKGNYFGIGAFDSSPYASAYTFDSDGGSKMRGGIIGGAQWIKEHYYDEGQKSLYDMIYGKKRYATDADNWINGISSIMNSCPANSDASLVGSEYDVSSSSNSSSSSSSNGSSNNKSYPGIFNMLRGYLNNSRAGRVFNSLIGGTVESESSSESDSITGSYAHSTSGDAKAVIQNAVNEIGYVADPSNTKHNKYNAFWSNNFTDTNIKKAKDSSAADWCANFVTWVMRHSGVSTSVVPNYSIVDISKVLNNGGKKVSPSNVYPGDLLFTSGNSHTGIVLGKIGDTIHTIEGNNDPYRVHIVSNRKVSSTNDNFARPNYKNDGSRLSPESIYEIAKQRSDIADSINSIDDPKNPLKEHESSGYTNGTGSNGFKPLSKYGRFKSSLEENINGDDFKSTAFELKKREYAHRQYIKRQSINKNNYGKGTTNVEVINNINNDFINTIIKILYTIADNTDKLNIIVSILNSKLGIDIKPSDINSKLSKATLKQKLMQTFNMQNMISESSKLNSYADDISDNNMNNIIKAMNAIASE